MLKNIPKDVKKQIVKYLENNQFTLAKQIYDAWVKSTPSNKSVI